MSTVHLILMLYVHGILLLLNTFELLMSWRLKCVTFNYVSIWSELICAV